MNGFLLGTLSAGALGLAKRVVLPRKAPQLHNLTDATSTLLEVVSWSFDPPTEEGAAIPLKDVFSIYLNSRGNRDWINERRLDSNEEGCLFLLEKIEQDHRLIKRLALACIGDRMLDRLIPNCHSSARHKRLLWTYADEQAVLGRLSDFCAPQDQNFISTRV